MGGKMDKIITKNISKKNRNEQKDRLLWNLICNGKSELTDRINAVNSFIDIVINTENSKKGYKEFKSKLHNGDFKKKDNKTIFLGAIDEFLFLFQSFRIAKVSEQDWLEFLKFYMSYKKVEDINIEYIENINYCDLNYK